MEHNDKQQPQQGNTKPALPPGWMLELKLAPDGNNELGGVAELWERDTLRCRLVLTRYGTDRSAAVARVNARVEYWLSEWLARPHRGDTGFMNLD